METPMTVVEMAREGRRNLLPWAKFVKEMMEPAHKHENHADIGETKANIMLAYRHLEDAIMRLGKVIQAQDGGTSIYSDPETGVTHDTGDKPVTSDTNG